MIREVKTFTDLPGKSFTTDYSYYPDGNLEAMTYPDGRVFHYEYDDAMRVSRVWSEKDGTTKDLASNVEHAPIGGVSAFTYGNSLTALRMYDMDYRLSYLKSGPMMKRSYGYDNNGNITSISDAVHPEKGQLFGYDALDRLTIANGAWGNLSYSYDSSGNRTDHAYVSGTNKLDAPYEYDVNGNMTSDGVLDYIYEATGGMVSFGGLSANNNLYAYTGGNPINWVDPSGLRKYNKGLWTECGPEEWAYCHAYCAVRGKICESCRIWQSYLNYRTINGIQVPSLRKAPKPSCNCEDDGPDSPPVFIPPPVSKDCKDNGGEIAKDAATVAAAVGAGYIIYRGVRLLPSLAPPLWWTLPANVALP